MYICVYNSLSGIYNTHMQGNISGQDEFVVYNAYRVMPEYIIKYYSPDASISSVCGQKRFRQNMRGGCVRRRLSTPLSPYPNPMMQFPPAAYPHRTPTPMFRGCFYPMPGTGAVPPGGTFSLMPPQSSFAPQQQSLIAPQQQSLIFPMPYPPRSN